MRKYRQWLYYSLLGLCWSGIVIWQTVEHRRVRNTVHQTQLNRAGDIANSLAVVIRAQRRFGAVPRPRLVSALEDLVKSRELLGIALLNPAGEAVAAGGQTIPGDLANLTPGSSLSVPDRLIAAFLVELGPEHLPHDPSWSANDEQKASAAILWSPEETPGKENLDKAPPPTTTPEAPTTDEERARRRAHWERMRSSHPFWQSEEKYRELYESQGLHMMVFMLDDKPANTVARQDLLVRTALASVAFLAFLFFGLAWRGINHSTQLQVRLVRARAMNNYLRELNLAAAGLAHETRNPLNIVRGITQTICGSSATPAATRDQLQPVMEEVDRITARLNEFIDYSKPREPHLSPVSPIAVARDVARTLESDFEDKDIQFDCPETGLQVMADATMLRQVLFNLMLNAVQALPPHGHLRLRLEESHGKTILAVLDDGPGIPAEVRNDIFRPYFSLRANGTGLGLAIVRQIVLAHGWEVTYAPEPAGGSIFSISGLEPVGRQQT